VQEQGQVILQAGARATRSAVDGGVSLLLGVLKVRPPNPLFRYAEPLWPFVAPGLGLDTTLHWVPFHCSISACWILLLLY